MPPARELILRYVVYESVILVYMGSRGPINPEIRVYKRPVNHLCVCEHTRVNTSTPAPYGEPSR